MHFIFIFSRLQFCIRNCSLTDFFLYFLLACYTFAFLILFNQLKRFAYELCVEMNTIANGDPEKGAVPEVGLSLFLMCNAFLWRYIMDPLFMLGWNPLLRIAGATHASSVHFILKFQEEAPVSEQGLKLIFEQTSPAHVHRG